jgi:hypothetical protein
MAAAARELCRTASAMSAAGFLAALPRKARGKSFASHNDHVVRFILNDQPMRHGYD